MDHSERRFGERNWSSQQEEEQYFQNFMRQNDPNRQDEPPMMSPQSSRMRNTRASETVSRTDVSSPFNVSAGRRRNTYDPSVMRMPSSTMSIPTRRSPSAGPKAPPIAGLDDDLDNLSLSDELSSASEEESTDQKPAAIQMQQVPIGIDIPSIGGPYASMVRDDHQDSTIGGSATSFPRNEDRWASGGAPTRLNTAAAVIPGALPLQIAVPPRRPNYPPLEPSVPESRLGRRCLIHKPKREADLVKGLVNSGATGSIRSRDTVVKKCANCFAELSVSHNAIAISCPCCYKISPAAKCNTVKVVDHATAGH
ncbi:unnamed protein product [Cylindrotheca closterium]|uniref:Uncharacterized protein n=1 Tax=Cylindrotheca closterium TaxID=2856 RepID=A0AAD2FFY2_9STRA|nr:unnamed protein product [Cylindrotheca closterium]